MFDNHVDLVCRSKGRSAINLQVRTRDESCLRTSKVGHETRNLIRLTETPHSNHFAYLVGHGRYCIAQEIGVNPARLNIVHCNPPWTEFASQCTGQARHGAA
jgi:hypothetical protein